VQTPTNFQFKKTVTMEIFLATPSS